MTNNKQQTAVNAAIRKQKRLKDLANHAKKHILQVRILS
jgi:hypothetical protein